MTLQSLKSFLIISFHVFLGSPLGKLPLTMMAVHLLDQALSSIFFADDQTMAVFCPVEIHSCYSILV